MITRKMKALSIVLVIFFLAGCGQAQVKNEPPAAQKPAEQEWKTFTDFNMGWSFQFPANWPIGIPSGQIGTSIPLYIGDPDVWISASAIYDKDDTELWSYKIDKNTEVATEWVTDQKQYGKMFYGTNEKKIVNIYFLESSAPLADDNIVYTIYAEMSRDFYEKNKTTIYKIAKSIKIFKPETKEPVNPKIE